MKPGDLGVEAARPGRWRSGAAGELADPVNPLTHGGQRGRGFLERPVTHPNDDTRRTNAPTTMPADDQGRFPRAARHVRGGSAAHPARSRRGRGGAVPRRPARDHRGRARRRRPRASCPSRTRSRARSASPSTRSRSTPTCSCSARSTSRSRSTSARRRARSSPTSPPSCRTRTRSARRGMWLAEAPARRDPVAANSTAEAAHQVARSKRSTGMASIGTTQGAKHAGLEILARDIEDHPDNQTRFVLVGYGIPAPHRPRQDVDRVLPARGPPGLAARDPPGVRGARDQPHQARVAPDEARASATTASSSTSKATSTTSWSPTACATSRRSRPR